MNNITEALETIKEFCDEETECDLCPLSNGIDCLVMRDAPCDWVKTLLRDDVED